MTEAQPQMTQEGNCDGLNVCAPDSSAEARIPNVMVSGGEAFGSRQACDEVYGMPVTRLVPFAKEEDTRNFLLF